MADGVVIHPVDGVSDVRNGAVVVVTLDRGSALNALTPAMVARLDACYRRFARDAGLYAVILKSADPKAFCAGGRCAGAERVGQGRYCRGARGAAGGIRLELAA